jgi:hypothetical protein
MQGQGRWKVLTFQSTLFFSKKKKSTIWIKDHVSDPYVKKA